MADRLSDRCVQICSSTCRTELCCNIRIRIVGSCVVNSMYRTSQISLNFSAFALSRMHSMAACTTDEIVNILCSIEIHG